jgi:hypothetical protein
VVLVEDGWIDASAPEDRAPRCWALGWPETGSSAPRPPGEVTDGGLRVSGTARSSLRAVTFRLGSDGRGAQIAAVTCRQGRMSGNRFGNPGAPTRRYGTALDEIGPPPEQCRWSWGGSRRRVRVRLVSEGRGFESLLGLQKRQVSGPGQLALLGHSPQLAGRSHLVPPPSFGCSAGC